MSRQMLFTYESGVRTRTLAWLFTCAFVMGQLVVPARGHTQARPVSAEIFVILARTQAGTIAPELADMPALRRPPFSNFHSMSVLSRERLDLGASEPREVTLPNGRRLQIALEQQTPDGRQRMRVSINRPQQADYLPLLQVVAAPGDPFFVAGQQHEGGTLIIGIRLIPAG